MNKTSRGFTVIEIIIVIVLLGFACILFFMQKNTVEVAARDEQRKVAINALYYSLEEVYFKQNNAYPRSISAEILPSVDPELFKDDAGVAIGESASEYRYEPTGCIDTKCTGYTLRTTLENEDDYIKSNR